MRCESVANAIQAVGVLVELGALVGIIWGPVLRPAIQLVAAWVRRLWPFRSRLVRVPPGGAVAGGNEPTVVIEHNSAPEDKPDAPVEQRLSLLVRRIENVEARLGTTEFGVDALRGRIGDVANTSIKRDNALGSKVEAVKRDSLQIRVRDASIFAIGVGVTAVGTVWATAC